jgi:hypothetical protein
MSGSLTWREYESDHGVKYSIKVDKSNSNIASAYGGLLLCKPRDSNLKLAPKTLKLRRVHCFAQYNPKLKRSFICGNRSLISDQNMEIGQEYLISAPLVDGDAGVLVWIISGYTGERFSVPTYYQNADTGLDDGTPFMDV